MHKGGKVRLLLVDDSPIALRALRMIIGTDPTIEVVGQARNGLEALEMIPALDPDVVSTDLYMPVMDGLELTREIMDRFPRPILVVSVAVRQDEPHSAFDLLEAGALDVVHKPRGGLDPKNEALARDLTERIRRLAGVTVFRRPRLRPKEAQPSGAAGARVAAGIRIIVIGASTGGPQALMQILPRLPEDFPVPILCVQHIGEGFLSGLVNWLDGRCRIQVRVAEEGAYPEPGSVYLAPERHQLSLDGAGRLLCPPCGTENYCPSIDTTFAAAAREYGRHALGLLLSGMGGDGAEGMLAIRRAGGITLAQDEETSIVFGMADRARALRAVDYLLPVQEISAALLDAVID